MSDTSSGYHEDYETSDGDELGTSYNKVPDVIMEQDPNTRSVPHYIVLCGGWEAVLFSISTFFWRMITSLKK